jgi:hypothetical protein
MLTIVKLNVIMLIVVNNAFMLNVVMLSVKAPHIILVHSFSTLTIDERTSLFHHSYNYKTKKDLMHRGRIHNTSLSP